MLFSSLIFLYLFLPITLLGYYLLPGKLKNYWLLLTSLVFFGWGGVSYSIILIGSIIFNYFFGLAIEKNREARKGYYWLCAGISVNLLLLIVFKYADFIVENINVLRDLGSYSKLPLPEILLPVGISFYTFHALSYLVDIYRGKTSAQKNILDMALYISMFSQLIAGPIIRYSDVWQQLKERTHSMPKFTSGVERFVTGLAKKVLLANTFAKVADTVFAMDTFTLSGANAWLGIIAYSMQIYYDFSGYSDMAIGLGRMFGFEFMENFNFPFLSRSIKEFWRRWHISLSTWFNDYVFNPFILARRDMGDKAVVYGLLFTFFLSGFWHGAGWNFIIFGLLHGIALVYDFLTKKQRKKVSNKMPGFLYNSLSVLLTYLYVCFTWIFFRADTFDLATQYTRSLFHFATTTEQSILFLGFWDKEFILALLIGVIGSFGGFAFIYGKLGHIAAPLLSKVKVAGIVYSLVLILVYPALLIMCTLYLTAGTYNPFIYFRF